MENRTEKEVMPIYPTSMYRFKAHVMYVSEKSVGFSTDEVSCLVLFYLMRQRDECLQLCLAYENKKGNF